MTPELWERIDACLARTDGLARADAEAVVCAEFANDDEAREAALGALREADRKTRFLRPPTVARIVGPGDERGLEGTQLGGFEIVERIGKGGMGVVYRALQTALGREVAVKVLFPSLVPDAAAGERFEREARAAAMLDHPSIARVITAGRDQGLAFLAMELVDGPSLARELEHLVAGEPAEHLPAFDAPEYVVRVVELVAQAAEGLAHAHAAKLVHRDVKPDNLLLDPMGRLRIVDFGLARGGDLPAITREGVHAGTPPYMSPEQLREEAALGPATDVYSLGVVLYELLTLRRPFRGGSGALFAAILAGEHEPLTRANPRVSSDLQLVCGKAMSRDARRRYADGGAFAKDLRSLLLHRSLDAKPPGLGQRVATFSRRHVVAIGFLLGALAALLVGFAWERANTRGRVLAEHLAAVQEVLARAEWNDPGELAGVRRRVQPLGDALDGPDELRAALATFRERVLAHRDDCLRRARELLRSGMAGRVDAAAFGRFRSPPSERDLGEAMRILRDACIVHWDCPEILALADIQNTYPRVTIRIAPKLPGRVPGVATARVQPIDSVRCVLGPARELGDLPLVGVPIPPGYWRFTVEVAGYGSAELTRYLVPSCEIEVLDAWIRPDAEVERDMVGFSGGALPLGKERPLGTVQVGEAVEYGPFLLDDAEASNDMYLRYLAESGAAAPSRWRKLGFTEGDPRTLPIGGEEVLARWRGLPVSGLTVREATLFAEWAGKRLPTQIEMQVALRGPAGLRHPWGDATDFDSGGRCNVHEKNERHVGVAAWFAAYLRLALPVRQREYRQKPSSLFHGYGNVAEWTESMLVEAQEGMLVPDPWKRVVMGGCWDSIEAQQDLASHAHDGVSDAYTKVFIGVRCARRSTGK